MLAKLWRKVNPLAQQVQPLWKTVWRFLKKLKIELPYDPAIAPLGIYPKDTNVVIRRDTCPQCLQQRYQQRPNCGESPNFHQLGDEWIKKMWPIYDRVLLSCQKE